LDDLRNELDPGILNFNEKTVDSFIRLIYKKEAKDLTNEDTKHEFKEW
jgi:hypothetical protein